ncbi:MAG: hypothetical protein JJD97_02365 [Gemmatimonadaceae bacterium]|nr:hypothetical protein [Gemmatimonadaceae bacterium]
MSSSSHTMPDVGTRFIILGADTVLAALPASPVQLAHACQALGFELAAPATWGDELIAERCLDQLADYEHPAAVMCSCPLVTERLTRASTDLEPFMLTFAPPPVATARYLRAAFSGEALHITYAGACPGADDASIDARLRPSDLLDAFLERGIVVGAQPSCFDVLVPLDRRRFYSLPGGTPARDHVERLTRRALIELTGDDVVLELSQQLIEQTPALLDLAVSLGCACAGAGPHAMRGKPRAGLQTLEPPRARQKVLDPSVHVEVQQTLIEACAHRPVADEEPAPLEVQLAADSAQTVAEIVDTRPSRDADIGAPTMAAAFDDASPDDVAREVSSASESDAEVAVDAQPASDVPIAVDTVAATATSHRRPMLVRSAARLPRSANAHGEIVPRASLAVLQRAMARITTRHARIEPKVERAPRSIAISSADLPRPVPPPPARHRPRTVLGLGLAICLSSTFSHHPRSHASSATRTPLVTVASRSSR